MQKPRQSIIARHPAECWRHEGTGTGRKKKEIEGKKKKIKNRRKEITRKDIPDDDRIIPVYCPLDREKELWTREDSLPLVWLVVTL